jgi:hypothetical protein
LRKGLALSVPTRCVYVWRAASFVGAKIGMRTSSPGFNRETSTVCEAITARSAARIDFAQRIAAMSPKMRGGVPP